MKSINSGISFIITALPNRDLALVRNKIIEATSTAGIPYEILVSYGYCPSIQRNIASKSAKFKFLYFLDDDSLVERNTVVSIKDFLFNNTIDIIGGPILLPPNSTWFERSINLILASPICVGPMWKRFSNDNCFKPKIATDHELILANLIINKDFFDKSQGFERDIYPGEENKFLIRNSFNSKIYYHPKMIVLRHQRKNIFAFIKQIFFYGWGRANNLNFNDWPFVLPAFFSIYVSFFSIYFKILWPLLLIYFLYLLFVFFYILLKNKKLILWEVMLVFITHYIYGIGIFSGILLKLLGRKPGLKTYPNREIVVEKIA